MKKKLFIPVIFFFSVLIFNSCSRDEPVEPQQNSNNDVQTILENLQILSPQPDVTWKPGSVQKITWSFPNIIKKVQIRLYRKQDLRATLAVEYANTGSFEWQIPEEILKSVHYRIQIFDVSTPLLTKTTGFFYIK